MAYPGYPDYRGKGSQMAEHAVLCVDDESHILSSLRRSLRKEPYRLLTAGGGAEGLEILAENPVQVVVSDQRMPRMCGTEFLAQVRQLYPDTVRIVLSGYAEADTIVASINRGEVYRFIAKPWEDEHLRSTILQSLEHHDLVVENRALQEQTRRHMRELERLNALLSRSVEERTRSLQFSQEVLESLPLMVLGISQEEEVVMTNDAARRQIAPLQNVIPGVDMSTVLPDEAVERIRASLQTSETIEFALPWEGRRFQTRVTTLGHKEHQRGCILLLEEMPA